MSLAYPSLTPTLKASRDFKRTFAAKIAEKAAERKVIPIQQEQPVSVPVPVKKTATLDEAFGPVVCVRLKRIMIGDIQRLVCRRLNIELADMVSARRSAPCIRPRHIAMWLARKLTTRSLPEIGLKFGGRDHTTVLSAVRKIEGERLADPQLMAELEEMKAELLQGR